MSKRNPFAKDLPEMAQGLREQAASETEADLGTTSYTHVIRGADEREVRWLDALTGGPVSITLEKARGVILRACMAVADAENATLTAELADIKAAVVELKVDHSATFREGMLGIREGTAAVLGVMTERGEALVEVDRLTGETRRLERVIGNMAETHRRSRAKLAERDATIEALTAQRDAANDENRPPEENECCASGRCEVCSPGYVWGRDR